MWLFASNAMEGEILFMWHRSNVYRLKLWWKSWMYINISKTLDLKLDIWPIWDMNNVLWDLVLCKFLQEALYELQIKEAS
jgi:hypothetical protein